MDCKTKQSGLDRSSQQGLDSAAPQVGPHHTTGVDSGAQPGASSANLHVTFQDVATPRDVAAGSVGLAKSLAPTGPTQDIAGSAGLAKGSAPTDSEQCAEAAIAKGSATSAKGAAPTGAFDVGAGAASNSAVSAKGAAVGAQSSSQDERSEIADVKQQIASLASMVHQLSTLVAAQSVAPPPMASAPCPAPTAAKAYPVPIILLSFSAGMVDTTPKAASDASSESSSSSENEDDDADEPEPTGQCRVCGGSHDELSCPRLSMNEVGLDTNSGDATQGGAAFCAPSAAFSAVGDAHGTLPDSASAHQVRTKDLKDLTFPAPPEDAGQARGYVNQVLMAIGRLQKSPGDELYLWAQDCLTKSDAQLKADQSFPRTDREVTAKLLNTCRKGKFGLLFQGMVEHERSVTGGMPNGRIMMASIFRGTELVCSVNVVC